MKKSKYLVIGILILGVMCLIKIIVKNSYAYYSSNEKLDIISAKIKIATGGEEIPSKVAGSDINVQLFMQDQSDDNKYNLINYAPVFGYTLNNEKSNCVPSREVLSYSDYKMENDRIKFTVKDEGGLNGPKQLICRIYYDKTIGANITVYALVQDNEFGVREYEGAKYRFLDNISNLEEDKYLGSECSYQYENIDLKFENGQFMFNTDKPNTCYAYFSK